MYTKYQYSFVEYVIRWSGLFEKVGFAKHYSCPIKSNTIYQISRYVAIYFICVSNGNPLV